MNNNAKTNKGRHYLGWATAFKHLKHDYIRLNLYLLELADAEDLIESRDAIYAFVKRSAFMDEVLKLKEEGVHAEDM